MASQAEAEERGQTGGASHPEQVFKQTSGGKAEAGRALRERSAALLHPGPGQAPGGKPP